MSNRVHITLRIMLSVWLLILLPHQVYAGVVVGGTRFIYNGNEDNGISLTIKNTDPGPWLVQTKILTDTGSDISGTVPAPRRENNAFIATPPLFRLMGNHESVVRIIRINEGLPEDRESVFRLSIATIPDGHPGSHSLQLAFRSQFKLFYRPAKLEGNASSAYEQLRWERHGATVSVTNPTPFYVTLFQLTVDGKTKGAAGMVAPFSKRTADWCPAGGNCEIQWQSLDDYGGVQPAWRVTPISTPAIGHLLK
ncbi:molecular chaperone [Hafnia paralvei]|uniref:Molecular chaperone n=1 Tax=Hafnia paralvei TaxID=546367 RepID=A0A4Q9EC99_9GAMM|nr:molecular chaperone [Hafnia paralvei]TBM21012.1 molecular chaperone [Hafnia paralvei]